MRKYLPHGKAIIALNLVFAITKLLIHIL